MKRSVRITFFLCLISTLCAILLTSCNIPIQLYTLSGLEYRINEDGETCTIIGIGKYKSTDLEIPEKIGDYMVDDNYWDCIRLACDFYNVPKAV
jgi:hypothetical protein